MISKVVQTASMVNTGVQSDKKNITVTTTFTDLVPLK